MSFNEDIPRPRIVVATHGRFAEGILDSLRMIAGCSFEVESVCAYTDEDVDYPAYMRNLVEAHDYEKRQLIVVTDLLGGSVHNEFVQLSAEHPFFLVSGLNLPMLIELSMFQGPCTKEALEEIVEDSRGFIKLCDVSELDNSSVESDF